MNREFLEQAGLEKDQIDAVMAEHGKAIQAEHDKSKEAVAKVTGLEEQLAQRDTDLEELKKNKGSSDDLNTQLQSLQEKYEQDTTDLQSKLSQERLDSAIEMALVKSKAKNNVAVKALLKSDTLELTDEGVTGLEEQLEAVKKENPYLFDSVEQAPDKPTFSRQGNPNSSADTREDKLRDILGIKS